MKNIFFFLLLLVSFSVFSQTTGQFRYDTAKFLKQGGQTVVKIEGAIQASVNGTVNTTTFTANSIGRTFILGGITTDEIVTFPTLEAGRAGTFMFSENRNESVNSWNIAGPVKDGSNYADLTTVPGGLSLYWWNNTHWLRFATVGGGGGVGDTIIFINGPYAEPDQDTLLVDYNDSTVLAKTVGTDLPAYYKTVGPYSIKWNIAQYIADSLKNIYNSDGTLLADRTVTGDIHPIEFNSISPVVTMRILNNDIGTGLNIETAVGNALTTYSPSNAGGLFLTNEGTPIFGVKDAGSGNTNTPMLVLQRQTYNTPLDGIGGSIDFRTQTTFSTGFNSNQILSTWTTVNHATRTSKLDIMGVNLGIESILETLYGTGKKQLTKYGIGTFTGVATYDLKTDGSGNIIETPLMEWYVSPSGNDANDGHTPATAWQTVSKVSSTTFTGGGTIYFQGGQTFTGQLTFTAADSGSVNNPLIVTSYGAGYATINGDSTHGVLLQNISNIMLKHLIVKGTRQPLTGATFFEGIYYEIATPFASTTRNIIFDDLEVYGFASSGGLSLYSYSESYGVNNFQIINSSFHDNANGIYIYAPGAGVGTTGRPYTNMLIRGVRAYNNYGLSTVTSVHSGSGIIMSGTTGGIIEYCEAYNNGRDNGWSSGGPFGIWLYEATSSIIRFSESHHNRAGSNDTGPDGGGFDIDGGCNGCVLEYNFSHDNTGPGYAINQFSGAATMTGNIVRYNISQDDARANSNGSLAFYSPSTISGAHYVYNNVFYCGSTALFGGTPGTISWVAGSSSYTALEVKNNIFIAEGTSSAIGRAGVAAFGSYANNYYHTINSASANFSTGGTVGDPLLRAPGTATTVGVTVNRNLDAYLDQYKVKSSSPCINAGATYALPIRDFYGNKAPDGTRDIGAHEF